MKRKKLLALLMIVELWFSALTLGFVRGQDTTSWASREQTSEKQKLELQGKFRKVEGAIPNRYIVILNDESLGVDQATLKSGIEISGESDAATKLKAASLERTVKAKAVEMARAHNGIIGHVYKHSFRGFSVEMTEAEAERLSRDPRVKFVEEAGGGSGGQVLQPTHTQQNAPWGLDRIDQADRPLSNTYQYDSSGYGVNVYVLDTGIRTTHSDFGGRATLAFDAVDDDNNSSTPSNTDRGGQDGTDCNGHGTHVAGTIGGATFGVAKSARLFSVRVLGRDSAYNVSNCGISYLNVELMDGIEWVRANHVKPAVINMSLYGKANDAVDMAVNSAIAAGITVVVIAGNDNADASNISPARVAGAITVGATNNLDQRAGFSNYGSVVDIWAPGEKILSAGIANDTATDTMSGTSMAAPHVAGVAALFLQKDPQASPATVQLIITEKSTKGKLTNIFGPGSLMYFGTGSSNRLLYSFVNLRPGYFAFKAKHSGKVLDVSLSGLSTANGATVEQWDYYGGDHQKWLLTPVGGGYYTIIAKHSGKALDVYEEPASRVFIST